MKSIYRSEKIRKHIASLPCVSCGLDGSTQAAHCNQGKGMGIKASDSTCMALCFRCHTNLDQPGLGAMSKEQRRGFEQEMNLKTLRLLIESGLLRPA